LAGMLWPDSLEETARDNLRHTLWRLRLHSRYEKPWLCRSSPLAGMLLSNVKVCPPAIPSTPWIRQACGYHSRKMALPERTAD
jgi:hypothetical protein